MKRRKKAMFVATRDVLTDVPFIQKY